MTTLDYWKETLSQAAEECGLTLTEEQLTCLADAAEGSHENYGMAFYSPPDSDRIADIERGWKAKVEAAEASAERYRSDFVRNICMRHRVEPSQVTLEGNGEATIRK
jgi:hypothetical protein